jgi:hypothetical protein
MPDGTRPTGPDYDDDFYAWTQYQAEVLRRLRTRDNRFDREHLAEEIEDLGKSERNAVRSHMERILLHFLKLAYSPARDPRLSWMDSIIEARSALDNHLSRSLLRDAEERLPRLYAVARKRAAIELQIRGENARASSLPTDCPFTIDQILADDWYPDAVPHP